MKLKINIGHFMDTFEISLVFRFFQKGKQKSKQCWMNASPTNLTQIDNTQKKALKIIGTDETTAS